MKVSRRELSKYKRQYKEIAAQLLYCPFLDCHIHFTRTGWRHLLYKRGRSREYADIVRRMKLLSYIQGIVQKAHLFQYFRKTNGFPYYGIEAIVTEDVENKREFQVVRIILKRDAYGKTEFFSVMERTVKIKK